MAAAASIDAMAGDDITAVAALHRAVFPGYFLTQLGQPFLERFYAQFVGRAGNYGLVARMNGSLMGFVVATCDSTALYRRFYRRNLFSLSLIVARRLVVCPDLRRSIWTRTPYLRQALRSVLRPPGRGSAGNVPATSPHRTARLLSIGIHPEHRGQGFGEQLVDCLCEQLWNEGMTSIGLSVRRDNQRAIAFYRRSGWQDVGSSGATLRFVRSTQTRQTDDD